MTSSLVLPHLCGTCSQLEALFEPTPSRVHPFGPLFPFCVEHGADGEHSLLTWQAWLDLWTMLAATSPLVALTSLHELGFTTAHISGADVSGGSKGAGGGICLNFSPKSALTECEERTLRVRRAAASCVGSGYSSVDPFSAGVGRVSVLGSAGCGKTTFIMHSINRQGLLEYSKHCKAAAAAVAANQQQADASSSSSSASTPRSNTLATEPTTRVTHYVLPAPSAGDDGSSTITRTKEDLANSSSSSDDVGSDNNSEEPEPRTLVVTVSCLRLFLCLSVVFCLLPAPCSFSPFTPQALSSSIPV